jgi:flagella basal body P-ring formation protein FlgA
MAVCGTACAGVDGAAAWRAVAQQVLMAELRRTHPHVDEWIVEPLVGRRQQTRLDDVRVLEAALVRVGKRSAVRLWWKAKAKPADTLIWFAVSGLEPMPVAKAQIRALSLLAEEMSEYQARDAMVLACEPIRSPQALVGMRARITIPAGAVICAESIEQRPAVGRGEQITVVSTAGAVTITGRAVAQEDGSIGEVLRVRSPSTGEVYTAAVTGEREVTVHD